MARLPSLKAVHYFDAAARHESFTLAAEELHVTQSAVSRMVQTLENELEVSLFLRSGRFIGLTPAGQAFHHDISEALEHIAQACQRLQSSENSQVLNVGANPAFATRWLVPRLAHFQSLHPNIHINLIGNETVKGRAKESATVLLRYGKGMWPGMVCTELPVKSPLGVVCAPALLKKHPGLREPSDLLGMPLLAYTGGSHDLWQDLFSHYGLPASALAQSRHFQQLLTLAEAAVSGLGFALVPLFLIEPELASRRLVKALPQEFEFDRKHYLIHAKGMEHDKKVQTFKRWILGQARQAAPH